MAFAVHYRRVQINMCHDTKHPFDQENGDLAIDTMLEDSFPASDPPSWTLGASAGDLSSQEQVIAPTGAPMRGNGLLHSPEPTP